MLRRTLALFSEATRSTQASSSADILTSHLSKKHLPPTLARTAQPHKNLYQLLSALPNDGVGTRVRQRRWVSKGLDVEHDVDLKAHVTELLEEGAKETKDEGHLCYWEVTKVRLKDGGNHGKAWGRLVWRGKPITQADKGERIPGALKYCWSSAH